MSALSRAIASGNLSQIEAQLFLPTLDANLKRKYRRQMRETLNRAGVASVKLQPKVLAGVFGRFDLTNPRSIRWAEQRSAEAVVNITNSIKQTIRTVISEGFKEGIPVRESARRIRQSIGLTDTQWRSVANFQNKMIKQGLGPAAAEKRAEVFSRKVLRRRALNIARTETIAASFQGRQELWDQARDKGLIDAAKVTRRWIVTPDDRLDEAICLPMPDMVENQAVPLDGMFTTGLGDQVSGPPAHPQCRCDVILNIPGRSVFD
jgi:hypothetical protein